MGFISKISRILHAYLCFSRHIKGYGVIIKDCTVQGNNSFFDGVTIIKSKVAGDVVIARESIVNASFLMGFNKIGMRSNISESTIGKYTYISDYGLVNKLDVGKYCSIGPNFKVGLGAHPINFLSTSPMFYKQSPFVQTPPAISDYFNEYKETYIGNDVWIGANVFIVDGVSIGNGAVIGAGSVVTKDVEDYAVVGGAPAKLIKYRYVKEIINELLLLKWWDKDIGWIRKNIHFFQKPIQQAQDIIELSNLE